MKHTKKSGFTLVELLVVIGIIGALIGILLPSLTRARKNSESVVCKSNLRQLGIIIQVYVNDYKGYLYPVGPRHPVTNLPTTLGTNKPPHERWPAVMFAKNLPALNEPLPYDPAEYQENVYDPGKFPAAPFTPKVMLCPSDFDPWEAHSYVLNQHLADYGLKFGNRNFGGLTSSEVIVAGEKRTTERDYHMERFDYDRVVEPYRHGISHGSNYLYFDGHVGTVLPNEALTGIDPWGFNLPDPSQGPRP